MPRKLISIVDKKLQDKIRYLRVWKAMTYQDIANNVGIDCRSISAYCKQYNLNPIYTNKEWLQKQYDELIHTKNIAEKYGFKESTLYTFSKKFDIVKDERIRMSNKYTLNDNYFKDIDTEHKAYWLGFIMADGCITKSDPKYDYNRFSFCLKDNESEYNHLCNFLKDIGSNAPITHRHIPNKKLNFESDVIEIRINSKIFVRHLMSHGITGKKTGKENIPNIENSLIKHFIRGFFDGDGCIKKDGRISLGSSSLDILESINEFAKVITEKPFKIYERKEYIVPFYLFESSNYSHNKAFLDWIYKDSTISLERKKNIYLSLFCPPLQ